MEETDRKGLNGAYRKEKDHRAVARMLAVHMVYARKAGIDETASHLMRSARWVRNWLRRYDEEGLDDLRDLPRSGRSMQFRPTRARAGEAMPHRRGKPASLPPAPKKRRKMLIYWARAGIPLIAAGAPNRAG